MSSKSACDTATEILDSTDHEQVKLFTTEWTSSIVAHKGCRGWSKTGRSKEKVVIRTMF